MFELWHTIYSRNMDGDSMDDVHTFKIFNTITTSELPNHKLRLKVEMLILLLRNIEQKLGLSNWTISIITRIGKYVLEANEISRSDIGNGFYIQVISDT